MDRDKKIACFDNKTKIINYWISSSFSLHEINILQECLKNNFGIIAKYYRDRNKGYRMYFNQEETKKLVKITYPYISRIPSMTYKVGIHNPVTTGFLPFAKKAG